MWVVVLFDLPMTTSEERKAYRDFAKFLEREGFNRLQLSVYGRPVGNLNQEQRIEDRVLRNLPESGQIRLIGLTDKQFSRMRVFNGRSEDAPETPPNQLTLI